MASRYTDKQRNEPRFEHPGLVFVLTSDKKRIPAKGRDLSLTGIGIELPDKLANYRLGAELELEFALPNHLRGLKIKVKLTRVNTDSQGHDHCGFVIIDRTQAVKKKVREMITFYEKTPRPFGRMRRSR